MPSDDELRRVAEDVRALARSLARDIRAALDRAREDMYGPTHGRPPCGPGRRSAREDLRAAGRAARHELRQAQMAVRHSAWSRPHGVDRDGRGAGDGPDGRDLDEASLPDRWPGGLGPGSLGPGGPPRWDNWGRRRHRHPAGLRPGGRPWPGGPNWSPSPGVDLRDRPPEPVAPPAPPLRHRHDGSTLLGLLAVVFGLAWLVAGTHVAHVSTEAVVAVALMVVGATTVVTARSDWALSRRTWPLFGGAALALVLLGLSASPTLPVGFRHLEFGTRTIAPVTWADVPVAIHGGFGKTFIDLSGLPTLTAPRTLDVDSAAGRVEITLPPNQKVIVATQMTAGQIEVNNVITSGVRRTDNQTLDATAPGPALTLRVQSGFGSMSIDQVGTVPFGGTVPPSATVPTAPSAPLPPKVGVALSPKVGP